jgi:glutathione S-transferase
MLAATNISFRNKCLDTNEELEIMRAADKLIFNQLPLLEMDGLEITQSQAMVRHLARKGGLYGSSDVEATQCDMIADTINDFQMGCMAFAFVDDKQAHINGRAAELVAKYAPRLERMVAKNVASSGTAHSVGKFLTYADVLLAESCTSYSELLDGEHNTETNGNWMADYPCLKAVKELVSELPGLKVYLGSSNRFPFPGGKIGEAYRKNVSVVLGR